MSVASGCGCVGHFPTVTTTAANNTKRVPRVPTLAYDTVEPTERVRCEHCQNRGRDRPNPSTYPGSFHRLNIVPKNIVPKVSATIIVGAALCLVAAGCSDAETNVSTTLAVPSTTLTAVPREGVAIAPAESATLRNQFGYQFPPAPSHSDGPVSTEVAEAFDIIFGSYVAGVEPPVEVFQTVGASGDTRAMWLISDLIRFVGPSRARNAAIETFDDLSSVNLYDDPVTDRSLWQSMTDHLIAWDIPAMPGYVDWKSQIFLLVEPRWRPFFDDANATIDWRHVSWGGVRIDDRPLGTPVGCVGGCIPALDDPAVTDAAGGTWYPDDALVFGITVDGESRAYPKNIMEIHEMVNDTLGGRRLGIPYCTLCGSAQAYLTDAVPTGIEPPVLRTSGLLSRSNKVMYDLETFSIIDTFTGEAVTGSLRQDAVVLDQVSVVTSTWGDWKRANPETTIVAEDGGVGRTYDLDPLGGRDDNGPIFPIGDVDERLPVQEKVLGVIADDGTPIAFPVAAARTEIDAGRSVLLNGITVHADGSGVRARKSDGTDAVGHEAFWFAWSQFHPATVVWSAA